VRYKPFCRLKTAAKASAGPQIIRTPFLMNGLFGRQLDRVEAISLAQEIHADAILVDDRVGRNAAIRCGLAVVGTVGLLEQSSARGLIDLPTVVERLRQTNARLDPELVRAALARDQARRGSKRAES
jgi:predicted nucleic acid-binding protein